MFCDKSLILIAQIVFLCSCGARHSVALSPSTLDVRTMTEFSEGNGKVAEIVERGTILIGTTGDYRPLSFCEADGTYWGFGIEVAKEIRCLGRTSEVRSRYWRHNHHRCPP